MRFTAIVASLLAAGSAVSAAPVENDKREMNFGGITGPLGGLLGGGAASGVTGSAQNGVADLFKLADTILNIPIDTIRKAVEGDPAGAATGLLQAIMKAASDVPKDAMGLVTPITNQATKAAKSS
ncbi:hypothetical protein ISF_09473 [Cordyceps fumosorosea ARSEF 2679]|uniref:Uncharacterized protein n=1 Tax=Cordyceps fumosorosea (strain ARSEF 2679) TaxID=1081104 RepID=A0A167I921_CORFA|nr:hypothetical protein ISF_09473 [Cordyceps fumosorosea ARSEF 2679]OAA48807.1 hypothetical protein ISF_09473 [Cordyceps fumosorosea ARSEF 2679]